jgi:hypothetical protein
MMAASLISLMAAAQVIATGGHDVQPSSRDNALQLLAIELFFLLIGLLVVAFLGYLIWESWRKKKEREKAKK